MNNFEENFLHLRSRKIERHPAVKPGSKVTPSPATSTPIHRCPPSLEQLSKSIQESTQFYRELSDRVDQSCSRQHITSVLFPNLPDPIIFSMANQDQAPGAFYNKELADLMTTNIPKFQLNSGKNPALELRSFIKSCENVLSLFDPEEEEIVNEFFKLIKFRLGYNVLERITVDKFNTMQDLETHLRSICHLKLNKGRLLSQIKNERQDPKEDVSHYVECLRKLIAQGRSEYKNDKEFERKAIHTLKNSVKNELISIKLMDSDSKKFEELAEIAINRDSELHQRSYNVSKAETKASQELINELMKKIKNLEANQTADIQHIRQDYGLIAKLPNNRNKSSRPTNSNNYCNYCRRSGHDINECQSKNRNQPNRRNFNSFNNTELSRTSSRPNNPINKQFINHNRNYQPPNYSQNDNSRPVTNNYRPQHNGTPQYIGTPQYNPRNYSSFRPTQNNPQNYNPRSSPPGIRNLTTKTIQTFP